MGLIANDYAELAIDSAHVLRVPTLPPIHADPFDRILVAQAMAEGLVLVSNDAKLKAYGGPVCCQIHDADWIGSTAALCDLMRVLSAASAVLSGTACEPRSGSAGAPAAQVLRTCRMGRELTRLSAFGRAHAADTAAHGSALGSVTADVGECAREIVVTEGALAEVVAYE